MRAKILKSIFLIAFVGISISVFLFCVLFFTTLLLGVSVELAMSDYENEVACIQYAKEKGISYCRYSGFYTIDKYSGLGVEQSKDKKKDDDDLNNTMLLLMLAAD